MTGAKHNQISKSQNTPHKSPLRASYGVFFARILEKIDRVITAPHCAIFPKQATYESIVEKNSHIIREIGNSLKPILCVNITQLVFIYLSLSVTHSGIFVVHSVIQNTASDHSSIGECFYGRNGIHYLP